MSFSPGSSGRLGPQERPLRARRAAAAVPLGPADRKRAGSPGAAEGTGRETPARPKRERPSPKAGRPGPHLRQRDLPLHPTAPRGGVGRGETAGAQATPRGGRGAAWGEPRSAGRRCGSVWDRCAPPLARPPPPLPRKPSGTSATQRFPFRGAPRPAPLPLAVTPRASRLQDGERGRAPRRRRRREVSGSLIKDGRAARPPPGAAGRSRHPQRRAVWRFGAGRRARLRLRERRSGAASSMVSR